MHTDYAYAIISLNNYIYKMCEYIKKKVSAKLIKARKQLYLHAHKISWKSDALNVEFLQ